MSRHRTQSNAPQAPLYAIVFGSLYVKIAVLILFSFMLLQPVGQVFAAAEGEVAEDTVDEPVADELDSEPEPEPEDVELDVTEEPEESAALSSESESELESDTGTTETAVEIDSTPGTTADEVEKSTTSAPATNVPANQKSSSSDPTSTAGEAETQLSTTTPNVPATTTASSSEGSETGTSAVSSGSTSDAGTTPEQTAATGSSTQSVPNFTPTSTATTVPATDEIITESAPSSPESDLPATAPTTPKSLADLSVGLVAGASTSEATTTVPEPTYVTMTATADPLHFTDTQCISVGDGSYYCSKETSTQDSNTATVFVELDHDADKEIYYKDAQGVTQITHNQQTDMAPDYDAQSHSIVWHRLIDGVYQIMHYDLTTETETQLSNTNTNNMEPTHEAGVTVWQRWVNDSWEIFLFDGKTEQQLTHNSVHDLAPDIEGKYVIWHTSNGTEKTVAVYEIATGLTSYIADGEGGQVSNPRFVLVYDTKFENGDTVTKGFNPETGTVVPLSAQPAETPIDLPEPEPTGETTALIQPKPASAREDGGEEFTGTTSRVSTSTTSGTGSTATTSAVSVEVDLVVTQTDVSSTSTALPLTEFDLIVEPFSASSSAQEGGRGTTTDSLE